MKRNFMKEIEAFVKSVKKVFDKDLLKKEATFFVKRDLYEKKWEIFNCLEDYSVFYEWRELPQLGVFIFRRH